MQYAYRGFKNGVPMLKNHHVCEGLDFTFKVVYCFY